MFDSCIASVCEHNPGCEIAIWGQGSKRHGSASKQNRNKRINVKSWSVSTRAVVVLTRSGKMISLRMMSIFFFDTLYINAYIYTQTPTAYLWTSLEEQVCHSCFSLHSLLSCRRSRHLLHLLLQLHPGKKGSSASVYHHHHSTLDCHLCCVSMQQETIAAQHSHGNVCVYRNAGAAFAETDNGVSHNKTDLSSSAPGFRSFFLDVASFHLETIPHDAKHTMAGVGRGSGTHFRLPPRGV